MLAHRPTYYRPTDLQKYYFIRLGKQNSTAVSTKAHQNIFIIQFIIYTYFRYEWKNYVLRTKATKQPE